MDKERRRAWRLANPEKHREEQRKYYAKHKKKVIARVRSTREQYSADQKEKQCKNRLKWQRSNREVCRAYSAKRKTKKSEAGGSYTSAEWFTLKFACGFKCLSCGQEEPLQADHVLPVSLGGSSFLHNIQPLCKTCNLKKSNKYTDYRYSILGINTIPSDFVLSPNEDV